MLLHHKPDFEAIGFDPASLGQRRDKLGLFFALLALNWVCFFMTYPRLISS
jgi:hypothetical protein